MYLVLVRFYAVGYSFISVTYGGDFNLNEREHGKNTQVT